MTLNSLLRLHIRKFFNGRIPLNSDTESVLRSSTINIKDLINDYIINKYIINHSINSIEDKTFLEKFIQTHPQNQPGIETFTFSSESDSVSHAIDHHSIDVGHPLQVSQENVRHTNLKGNEERWTADPCWPHKFELSWTLEIEGCLVKGHAMAVCVGATDLCWRDKTRWDEYLQLWMFLILMIIIIIIIWIFVTNYL